MMIKRFFRCYHSEELPVLIDMSMPSLIKIPEGSPGTLPGALGCLCHPGPSFPVARVKSRVPAVQNEQGRKWDIQLTKSGTRVFFAEDLDVSGHSATARPAIDPGPVPSAQKKFALHCQHFFWHLPFFKFPDILKKGALVSNPHFTRGFRQEVGPASTREHFHSMRKVIPDISVLCPKSFHFREKCELENSKKFIRSQTESNVCR